MIRQVTMDDLLRPEKPKQIPKANGEKVIMIPEDVYEHRCRNCIQFTGAENTPVPLAVVHMAWCQELIPCRILAIARCNDRTGECMSFAPRFGLYGVCESCRHNNIFHDGFCEKEDHAEQRRVYYGTDYGGDERKVDYYSRHRLSVCDDYEPDQFAKEDPNGRRETGISGI